MSELQSFFYMGGYALYVWTSYAVALVVLLGIVLVSNRQLRLSRDMVRRKVRQQQNERGGSPRSNSSTSNSTSAS